MFVREFCAILRFSTAGMPEPARARAIRDLHLHERTLLSAKLDPIGLRFPMTTHNGGV
jgi:hypothetical protein